METTATLTVENGTPQERTSVEPDSLEYMLIAGAAVLVLLLAWFVLGVRQR